MIERFEIIDFNSPRPEADQIIFCDGSPLKAAMSSSEISGASGLN